jgi:phosphoribosylanthranilate isomerase
MLPFRIKVCGVRSVDDALMCARAGADAVGLNFYPASKRAIDETLARQIVAALPPHVTPVAVVVNRTPDDVLRLCREVGVQWVQLHGDESPDDVAALERSLHVVRARRVATWEELALDLSACDRAGRAPEGWLVDAVAEGEYGGSGQVANWQGLADRQGAVAKLPLILAGGLTPANVAQGIHTVRPWGVDTASGVEAAPGVKHPQLVDDFVAAARQALDQIGAEPRD